MAITIKSLNDGKLQSASLSNIFTTATNAKAAVVRNIRFVNPSSSLNAWLTVAFARTANNVPGAARLIAASPIWLPPKAMFVVGEELTLEYGGTGNSDAIQAKAVQSDMVTPAAIDFVISGMERNA